MGRSVPAPSADLLQVVGQHAHDVLCVDRGLGCAAGVLHGHCAGISFAAHGNAVPQLVVALLLAREVFLSVLLLIARAKGLRELPVHFVGKAATFNLLYAFPLLLLADGRGRLADIARPVAWGFAWWGIVLYWVAGLMYAVQLRRYLAARRLHPVSSP